MSASLISSIFVVLYIYIYIYIYIIQVIFTSEAKRVLYRKGADIP